MKRKPPKPQPKPMKSEPPRPTKSGLSEEERVALSAVTALGEPEAGEVSMADMQAMVSAVGAAERKKRPAGAKEGAGSKRKPGPRRRTRG